MHDAWFADENQVRKKVGLLEEPVFQILDAREVSSVDISVEFNFLPWVDFFSVFSCLCISSNMLILSMAVYLWNMF